MLVYWFGAALLIEVIIYTHWSSAFMESRGQIAYSKRKRLGLEEIEATGKGEIQWRKAQLGRSINDC